MVRRSNLGEKQRQPSSWAALPFNLKFAFWFRDFMGFSSFDSQRAMANEVKELDQHAQEVIKTSKRLWAMSDSGDARGRKRCYRFTTPPRNVLAKMSYMAHQEKTV